MAFELLRKEREKRGRSKKIDNEKVNPNRFGKKFEKGNFERKEKKISRFFRFLPKMS